MNTIIGSPEALTYGLVMACLLAWLIYQQFGHEMTLRPIRKFADDTMLALILTAVIIFLLFVVVWGVDSMPADAASHGWQPPLSSRPHWLD